MNQRSDLQESQQDAHDEIKELERRLNDAKSRLNGTQFGVGASSPVSGLTSSGGLYLITQIPSKKTDHIEKHPRQIFIFCSSFLILHFLLALSLSPLVWSLISPIQSKTTSLLLFLYFSAFPCRRMVRRHYHSF